MGTKAEHSPYLLSWLSFTKDFEKDGTTVNTDNGPNYCLHRDFYAPEEGRHFSRHVILYHNEERSRLKAHHLRKKLREDFPGRPLEFIEITTEGPSDYPALISGLQSVLKRLDTNDIHAFTPIGTTAVRYSWLYAAVNLIGGNKKLSLWHSPPPPEGADWRSTKYRYEVLPFKLSGYGLSAYAANTGSAPKPDFFEAEILKKVYREARGLGEIRNVNVLIKGETGTGKENLAREVHHSAGNKTARFEKNYQIYVLIKFSKTVFCGTDG